MIKLFSMYRDTNRNAICSKLHYYNVVPYRYFSPKKLEMKKKRTIGATSENSLNFSTSKFTLSHKVKLARSLTHSYHAVKVDNDPSLIVAWQTEPQQHGWNCALNWKQQHSCCPWQLLDLCCRNNDTEWPFWSVPICHAYELALCANQCELAGRRWSFEVLGVTNGGCPEYGERT